MKKKKIYLFVFSLALFIHGQAQVTIGDITAPQPFSTLELMTNNTKGGIRLPQLTTAQRDSIALTPAFVSNPNSAGLVIYNTDTNCLEFWNLDHWVSRCAPPCAAPLRSDIPASIALGGYTWSTKNVDAPGTFTAHTGDPGMFYQWDSKIGWSSSDPMTSNPAGQTWSATISSNTVWDLTNNNPCPSGWSVPTDAELKALHDAGSVWIDSCTAAKLGLGTLPGRIFGTTTVPATYADFNPNAMLFLPAPGNRDITSGALNLVGISGRYWSSVQALSASNAYYLFVNSNNSDVLGNNKANSTSVRCVAP